MLATEYAKYYKIAPQGESETDAAFTSRVSGALRDAGHIIEAHEVAQNKLYDADGGDNVIAEIAGAVAMALQGKSYGSTGGNRIGDEIAAGVVATSPKRETDLTSLLLAIMLSER